MQLTHLTREAAAQVLAESTSLTAMEWPGTCTTHVLNHAGRDFLLMIHNATGDAMMVDGCAHDNDSGGSIHDHARAIFGEAANAA